MSNFKFCPIIWHFFGKQNSDKLALLQYRALKHVYYNAMILCGDIRFYVERPSYMKNFVTLKYSKYSLRYENILEIPRVNSTKCGINSLRYIAARVWNSLPSECRSACDFTKFKDMIKNSWNGIKWKCSLCNVSTVSKI